MSHEITLFATSALSGPASSDRSTALNAHAFKAPHFNATKWISNLIDNIGEAHFFPWIAQQLSEVIPHEFCLIFQYRKERSPRVLFDGLSPLGYRAGLENFLKSTWQINPFYSAFQEGLEPGLHTMEAISRSHRNKSEDHSEIKMQPSHDEEIGYLTDGWPSGMQELMLAVPIEGDDVIEISLSQRTQQFREDVPLLTQSNELVPIIISAIKKHCEMIKGERDYLSADTSSLRMPQLDLLTTREEAVMKLILSGHGSEAIGLHLDIALPTVKTHRRNLYRKLGISSQAELFALLANRQHY